MLGKLLKNEIKHSGRYVMTIYAAAAAVIVFMLIGMLTKVTWIGVVSAIVLYLAAIVAIVMTLISVIKNFYDTLYTNQGYLTFTLPVKCSSLLISKVLISFFWILLSFVLAGVCIAMIVWNAKAHGGDMIGIGDIIDMAGLREMLPSGAMIAELIAIVVAVVLLHILTFVGFVYFAVTIANTRPLQNHPKLFGFLIFFLSYGISNSVAAKLTYSFPLTLYVETDKIGLALQNMSNSQYLVSFGLAGTIFMALIALGMLFFTGYIMEHKVNIK